MESAVYLVAPENGPDRQFERLLNAADRLDPAAKPILEIYPCHERIVALAKLGENDKAFLEDVAICSTTKRPCSTVTSRSTPGHSRIDWPG